MIFILFNILVHAKSITELSEFPAKNIAANEETETKMVIKISAIKNVPALERIYYVINKDNVDSNEQTIPHQADTNWEFQVEPPCVVKVYADTASCSKRQIQYVAFISMDIGKTQTRTINSDSIPNECKLVPQTYYIEIRNDLPDKYESKLFVKKDDETKVEIIRGQSYKESRPDSTETFSVEVYLQTSICTQQKLLKTVTASNKEIVTSITVEDILEECIPYEICLNFENIPEGYSIGYTSSSASETLEIPENKQLALESTEEFTIQLNIIKLPQNTNCNPNHEIGSKYTAVKKFECQTISISTLIPDDCKVQYKVCFDISKIYKDFKLGYTIETDSESSMQDLTNSPIINAYPFKAHLYLIDSPLCSKDEIHIDSFTASPDFECVTLEDSDIGHNECKTPFYITILNKLSTSYDLYIKFGDFYQKITNLYHELLYEEATLSLYVKSDNCLEYTSIKEIKSTKDKEKLEIIDDTIVPQKCLIDDATINPGQEDSVESILIPTKEQDFSTQLKNKFESLNENGNDEKV